MAVRLGQNTIQNFPSLAPPGTNWNKVGFELINTGHIKVSINRTSKQFSLVQLKEFLPEQSRIILFNLISSGGFLDPEKIECIKLENRKHAISRFRKKMKILFGIDDDPLLYESGEYKAQFSTNHSRPSS